MQNSLFACVFQKKIRCAGYNDYNFDQCDIFILKKSNLRCGSAIRAAARQFLFTCLRNEKINTGGAQAIQKMIFGYLEILVAQEQGGGLKSTC